MFAGWPKGHPHRSSKRRQALRDLSGQAASQWVVQELYPFRLPEGMAVENRTYRNAQMPLPIAAPLAKARACPQGKPL